MVSSYRPLVSSSRLWLTALALCFHISEASARSHYHPAPQVCYNQNNQRIPCPKKTKKQWLIGVIIAASVIGVIIIGCIFYFCCAVGECACATCAACCCLCCSKRKKTSGGQVYQTLPDQGNNATIPQSTYTPNTMSYSYNAPAYPSSDAPYDPPRPTAFAETNSGVYEKYDTNTAVSNAASGHGEAASYYNNLPELKYDHPRGASNVSLTQPEVPAYQPPSYPPTSH